MAKLVLCSGCARHFRRSEAACPFCGAAIDAAAVAEAERAPLARGISRAKRYAMQAAILAGTAGMASAGTCGGSGNQEVRHVDSGSGGNKHEQPKPVPQPHYDDDDMPAKPYGCVWPDPEDEQVVEV